MESAGSRPPPMERYGWFIVGMTSRRAVMTSCVERRYVTDVTWTVLLTTRRVGRQCVRDMYVCMCVCMCVGMCVP